MMLSREQIVGSPACGPVVRAEAVSEDEEAAR